MNLEKLMGWISTAGLCDGSHLMCMFPLPFTPYLTPFPNLT